MLRRRFSARACPERVHLETLSDRSCGSNARFRVARALGFPRRRAELSVQADPPASPFAGGTDAVARLLAFKLSPALGEQVLPEQRLGAGGNIAHRAAAEAPPDGYTLLMGAPPW